MVCSSILVGRVQKAMQVPQESLPLAKPIERAGLSRFYKSKSQSFRCINEAVNTEYGESAWGLAKRVKFWHQEEAPAADCCVSCSSNSQADKAEFREWNQLCTEQACSELRGLSVRDLSVRDSHTSRRQQAQEVPVFHIGSTSAAHTSQSHRSRKRDRQFHHNRKVANSESVTVRRACGGTNWCNGESQGLK